eukprot:476187-Pleurochrysis_carterae.AAC.1
MAESGQNHVRDQRPDNGQNGGKTGGKMGSKAGPRDEGQGGGWGEAGSGKKGKRRKRRDRVGGQAGQLRRAGGRRAQAGKSREPWKRSETEGDEKVGGRVRSLPHHARRRLSGPGRA